MVIGRSECRSLLAVSQGNGKVGNIAAIAAGDVLARMSHVATSHCRSWSTSAVERGALLPNEDEAVSLALYHMPSLCAATAMEDSTAAFIAVSRVRFTLATDHPTLGIGGHAYVRGDRLTRRACAART